MKALNLILIATFILLASSLTSAAQPEQSHNLSEIHPIDIDFDMQNYGIYDLSHLELRNGLNLSGYAFYDQGNNKILEWDNSNAEWDVLNANLNMNNNNITGFFDSDACPAGEVVNDIYDNGTYSCQSLTDAVSDQFVDESGDTMEGNLNLSGYNLTDIDTLHFEQGMKINGSIETSGGDLDLDNGSIDDVYSIDGGGDAVRFDNVINMNGNSLNKANNLYFDSGDAYMVQDSDGNNLYIQADDSGGSRADYITIDPSNQEVKLSTPALDMSGNNIINPGNTDGIDLDFPGNGLGISNSRYVIVNNAIGNSELNNSQSFTVGSLTLNGQLDASQNRIINVPAPQSGGDAVNKSYVDDSDDTVADNQTLAEVLDQGNSAIDDNIDLSSQDLQNVRRLQFADRNADATHFNITESGGNLHIQKDGSKRLNILKGGGIQISNGNLNVSFNQIRDIGTSGVSFESNGDLNMKSRTIKNTNALRGKDSSDQEINFNNNGDIELSVKGGGKALVVKDQSANVQIPNGNLDVGGNNITSIDTLKFVEGTSINGDLELNGTINATDDLNMEDSNINNVRSIDGGGDSVKVDDNLDMNENEIQNVDGLQDGSGTHTIHFDGSNNVEVPNGAIDVQGNVNTVSGTVSSTNKMCIGDQCS